MRPQDYITFHLLAPEGALRRIVLCTPTCTQSLSIEEAEVAVAALTTALARARDPLYQPRAPQPPAARFQQIVAKPRGLLDELGL